MMTCMSTVVTLFAILLKRDMRDVFCFLVMLVVSVAMVLVFVVKGF